MSCSGAPPSFGAALVGFAGACFLCGCMLVQCYIYAKSEPAKSDPPHLKLLIVFICLVDLVHLFVLGCYVYGALIVHFGDPDYLEIGPWSFAAAVPLSVLTSTPVQFFYAWRVYVLGNRHRLLPFIICLFSSLAFVSSLITTVRVAQIVEFKNFGVITWAADTWLGSNILTDIIIVSSLCYFLSHGRTGFTPTDQTIDKLLYLIVNTGLAPTVMELSHLISFTIAAGSHAHLAFNFLAPKLYANSLMASLNARLFVLKDVTNASNSIDSSAKRRITDRFEMNTFRPRQLPPLGGRNDVFDVKVTTDYHSDSPNYSAPEIHGNFVEPLAAHGGREV